jgi:hypothetical protein
VSKSESVGKGHAIKSAPYNGSIANARNRSRALGMALKNQGLAADSGFERHRYLAGIKWVRVPLYFSHEESASSEPSVIRKPSQGFSRLLE